MNLFEFDLTKYPDSERSTPLLALHHFVSVCSYHRFGEQDLEWIGGFGQYRGTKLAGIKEWTKEHLDMHFEFVETGDVRVFVIKIGFYDAPDLTPEQIESRFISEFTSSKYFAIGYIASHI